MKELQEVFFSDPRWEQVEKMILDYINSLLEMDTIDLKQPAEHVKAEIIGRTIAYEKLSKFLSDTKLVSENKIKKINIYR